MFLIPLGLQSRIIKWPLATLLIMILTGVASVYYFSENSLYIRNVRQAMLDSKILDARKSLLFVSCPGQFPEDTCRYVRSHLSSENLLEPEKFMEGYRKEFPDASFLDLRKIRVWLAEDRLDRALKNTEFQASPEYQNFVITREHYLRTSLEKSKADRVFIRGNSDPVASLKAMVTHDGWVHLIGNMAIFLLFAVFLEQRVGSFGLLLLYVLGGLGSNYLQLPFLPMGVRLYGASGAVSAVIGAFAAYFWREKMRCWMSLGFVFNRMVLMPAWLYIGSFLLLSDLVGVFGAGSGVAHLAHLTGFLIGFIFAFMQMDLFPLKSGFLFKQEQNFYYQAKETSKLDEKMVFFQLIHSLNQESYYAFRGLFIYFNKQSVSLAPFSKFDLEFLSQLICQCLSYREKNEKYPLTRDILCLIPLSWNLATLDLKVGPVEIIETAEDLHQRGNIIHCLRFYDLFFALFAAHAQAQDINTEIIKIFDEIEKLDLESKGQLLEALLAYSEHHPDNHFQTQIRQLSHQVLKEEKRAAS